MMYVMLYTILVMAYMCMQCTAFRRINYISIMPISTINNKGILSRFHHQQHKTSNTKLIYTIRGGSDEYNNNNDDGDDNQYNNGVEQYDDEYIDDFISSFEAEIADIRRECCELLERIEDDVEATELDIREAELEAENEMQKLRGLIDRRVEEDMQREEVYDIESEDYDENVIESNEQLEDEDTAIEVDDSINDEPIGSEDKQIAESEVYQDGEELDNAITDNEGEEEELVTIQDGDTLVDDSDRSETEESDEELSNDMEIEDNSSNHDDVESEDTIDLDSDTEYEISGETVMVEDDDYLPYDEITELPNEPVVFGDYSEESEEEESDIETIIFDTDADTPPDVDDDEIIEDDKEEIIQDEIIQEVKSKTSKKGKKNSSKQGKENKKIRITESEDEEGSSDGTEIAVGGDSVMLTQTEDEVAQPQQSGLLYYLRSDLMRALCLFAATVALAIITKRMERQLLAAEAAEAASSST